jgi:hypothetical protein
MQGGAPPADEFRAERRFAVNQRVAITLIETPECRLTARAQCLAQWHASGNSRLDGKFERRALGVKDRLEAAMAFMPAQGIG